MISQIFPGHGGVKMDNHLVEANTQFTQNYRMTTIGATG